jgi:outer membrane receptor protein involved in Fe transport
MVTTAVRPAPGAVLLAVTLTLLATVAEAVDVRDEIIVTGTRIESTALKSATPVTVLGDEQLKQAGSINASDVLRQLPSIGTSTYSTTNSNFSTSDSGVNTINLRNLGESRTLVLINGRRVVPGLSGDSAVDFNIIPTDFIDRIEVITGGASAVYGSEAVAGVVNVVLKQDYDGLHFRTQYGISEEGDADRYLGSMTFGTGFDEGNGSVLFNISYDKDEGLFSRDRDRSSVDRFLSDIPAFSSYAPQGRFTYISPLGDESDIFTFNPDNTVKTGFDSAVDGFNRSAFRRISVPVDRTLFSSLLNYDLAAEHRAYGEFTYAVTRSSSELEPFALDKDDIYGFLVDVGIPITNAYIPASIAADIAARNVDGDPDNNVIGLGMRKRLLDIDNRGNNSRRQTNRIVLGVTGDLYGEWDYDAYYIFGRTTDAAVSFGQVNVLNFANALDTVGPAASATCASVVAVAQGCVPVNVFGFNSIRDSGQAAIDYLNAQQSRDLELKQNMVSLVLSGPVTELPAGTLQGVVGIEHRTEKSAELWDALTNAGLNGGNLLPDVVGNYDVDEIFGEVSVPIIADRPMVSELTLQSAVRLADYSTVGDATSWNVRLTYAPIEQVRFRGAYAEATRAPNIDELFSSRAQTFPTGITDPCDGVTAVSTGDFDDACRAIPAIADEIAANGVFAYTIPLDYQNITGFDGGNPNLKEETAQTWTVGVVLTPSMIEGLTVQIDYFDIDIDDAVDVIERQVSIDSCLLTGDPVFCGNVIRFSNTGKLDEINATNINTANITTAGVEVQVSYLFDMLWDLGGTLDINLSYTHLDELEKVNFPGAPVSDFVDQLSSEQLGRLGSGFEHRAALRTTYARGPATFTWTANHLSAIQDTLGGDTDPDLAPFNRVGSRTYHNVQGRYRFGADEQITAFAGIDNLFDRDPPLLPEGTASVVTGTETAATEYDVFGRYFYAGAELKF